MKRLTKETSEFSKKSFLKNANLFNENKFEDMYLNENKIKSISTSSTKISPISFKAKNINHVGFYKEKIDYDYKLLNENYKLILGLTTKSEITNCDVYVVQYDPIDGNVKNIKESTNVTIQTNNVSPLRNIQTLDGPKGDNRHQKFVISLHEKTKLTSLESFKTPSPKKLEESIIRKNGLNFITPLDDVDLPKAIDNQEQRLGTILEETFLLHMFDILKSYNTNNFIEFYVQNYKKIGEGFYSYSKKQGLDCIRLYKNELNDDKVMNLLKNIYGEDNINFLLEFPRDLNKEFIDIFNSDLEKLNSFLTYSEKVIRHAEVLTIYDKNEGKVKETRIKDFNPSDINDDI